MTASTESLQRTPLYSQITELKARMTGFGGWDMPVQFSGLIKEHEAVRSKVGLFDISHMGKFVLRGETLLEQLQRLVPSDLSTLQPGQAQYTVLLTEQAGIIDDLIIYHQGEVAGQLQVTLIVNAATCATDKEWLLANFTTPPIELRDLTHSHILLALQGPKTTEVLRSLIDADLESIGRFGHAMATYQGETVFLARTGYTGEDGFEIMLPNAVGQTLWSALLAAEVTPCGLGARDTLRLEAAMALYGQDIDSTTTPLEAGLSWLVHLDRTPDFIGKSVLAAQKANGVQRRLVGLATEGRNIARHGYPIVINGQSVGEVTSGTWSPTLQRAIALAYVPAEYAKVGTEIDVEIRGKAYPAKVVKKPFYKRSS